MRNELDWIDWQIQVFKERVKVAEACADKASRDGYYGFNQFFEGRIEAIKEDVEFLEERRERLFLKPVTP